MIISKAAVLMKKTLLLLIVFGGIALAQAPAPSSTPAPAATRARTERMRSEIERSRRLPQDWANLSRYRAENQALGDPKPDEARVVFMGDSITDSWGRRYGKFFPGKPYINRG